MPVLTASPNSAPSFGKGCYCSPSYNYAPYLYADDIMEARESAKDELFLRKHPESINAKHNLMTIGFWGGITTLASLLLTKSIKMVKESGRSKITIDPPWTAASLLLGLGASLASAAILKENSRKKRYIYEMLEEQQANKTNRQIL